jgi:hypothetical protein
VRILGIVANIQTLPETKTLSHNKKCELVVQLLKKRSKGWERKKHQRAIIILTCVVKKNRLACPVRCQSLITSFWNKSIVWGFLQICYRPLLCMRLISSLLLWVRNKNSLLCQVVLIGSWNVWGNASTRLSGKGLLIDTRNWRDPCFLFVTFPALYFIPKKFMGLQSIPTLYFLVVSQC